ncbi:MAG TPA: MFS transporter [Candidatus Bathyarchaeia archaeon]|nr:MFS transporter [Candidatus Bathyarchaeia archaeon]
MNIRTEKFPYFRTFLTSMGFFTLNLSFSVYSIYVPLFLRNNLGPMLGDVHILNTLVGVIMVLDNIAAILLSPVIGNLSDRVWVKKLGRRMPFVIIGIPLAAMFFGLIGTFENMFFWLLFAICGFNISMAIYNTPVVSLIPDTVPDEHMSQGNSVMNIVGGLANITGLLLSAYLYSINHALAFWVMGGIMILCLIILILNVREKQDKEIDYQKERIGLIKTIKQIFKDKNIALIFILFTVFAHNAGYQAAETFFSSYAQEFLAIEANKAANILGVFLIIQIVMALPAGYLTKKIGAINASLIGVIFFLLGFIPISIISMINIPLMKIIITLNGLQFSWEFFVFAITIFIMGFGWILLFMNLILIVWNVAPKGKTATYTSFYSVFWNLAAILSPLIAGGFFDLIENITGINGLQTLFILVAGIYIFALTFLLLIKARLNRLLKLDFKETEKLEERIKSKDIPLRFLPLILFGVGLRQKESFQKLKAERLEEKKQIKEQIKNIKNEKPSEASKMVFTEEKEEEILDKKKQIKEHKQQQKESRKEFKEQTEDLMEELLKEKIKTHLEKKVKSEKKE